MKKLRDWKDVQSEFSYDDKLNYENKAIELKTTEDVENHLKSLTEEEVAKYKKLSEEFKNNILTR